MDVFNWFAGLTLVIFVLLAVSLAVSATTSVKQTATRSFEFKATPEQLWAAISNPSWQAGDYESYEELPVKNGHRMWVVRTFFNLSATLEEAESDPPYKLVIKSPGGTDTYLIEPIDGGSRLTITEDGGARLYICSDSFRWGIWRIRWRLEHPESYKQPDQ